MGRFNPAIPGASSVRADPESITSTGRMHSGPAPNGDPGMTLS